MVNHDRKSRAGVWLLWFVKEGDLKLKRVSGVRGQGAPVEDSCWSAVDKIKSVSLPKNAA